MTEQYILTPDGERPIPCDDIIRWCNWMQRGNGRVVAQEHINNGTIIISTVFLGFAAHHNPRLWETMAFNVGPTGVEWLEIYCQRCSGTREQAVAQHNAAIQHFIENETQTPT